MTSCLYCGNWSPKGKTGDGACSGGEKVAFYMYCRYGFKRATKEELAKRQKEMPSLFGLAEEVHAIIGRTAK